MAHGGVTVFGGSGFIGRYVVRALAKTGVPIRVAGRRPEKAMHLKPMGDVGQIVPVAANLRNEASVAAAIEGSEAVINLVGLLTERGAQKFDAVHVGGAASVARAAAAAGVGRLVHISAIGAAHDSPGRYGRTKAAGEDAVRSAFPGATILRPSVVFGPEDEFFNLFARLARYFPVLPLIGGGHTRFQPVYVCDVADSVLRCLKDADSPGETFELGGPHVYTFREILEFILAETRRNRLLVPVPFWAMKCEAAFLELLPSPPVTRDQIDMLRRDNVVAPGARGLPELGIAPSAAEAIVPAYLAFHRKGGPQG